MCPSSLILIASPVLKTLVLHAPELWPGFVARCCSLGEVGGHSVFMVLPGARSSLRPRHHFTRISVRRPGGELAGAGWSPRMVKGKSCSHVRQALCGPTQRGVGVILQKATYVLLTIVSGVVEPSSPYTHAHLDGRCLGILASCPAQTLFPRVVSSAVFSVLAGGCISAGAHTGIWLWRAVL